jgi:glycosyltransferase involved in cell wall biosynthesis
MKISPNKLRIAVLVDKEVPTDHSFIQGVLEKSLPGADCHVTFVGYGSVLPIHQNDNVTFLKVPAGTENFFFKKLHKLRHFTQKIRETGPYEVLYTRNDPVFLIIAWWLKLKGIVKVHFHQISHLHAFSKSDRSILYRIKSFGDLFLRKFFLKYADRILVISDQMKHFLNTEWPAFSTKYVVYPLGVAVSDFDDIKPYLIRKYDVVYIGTLASSRRIDIMIDAIKIHNEKYTPVKFHIWGASHNPKDDAALKAHAANLGMNEHVVFYGKIGRQEVLQKLMNTKIGLSAIPSDGILNQISPTKLMEYLAAGCCVIATDGIRDQEEIVGEAYGPEALIKFRAEAIAEVIQKLNQDEARAMALSENGRNYIFEKRSYTEMAGRLKAQMQESLNSAR